MRERAMPEEAGDDDFLPAPEEATPGSIFRGEVKVGAICSVSHCSVAAAASALVPTALRLAFDESEPTNSLPPLLLRLRLKGIRVVAVGRPNSGLALRELLDFLLP